MPTTALEKLSFWGERKDYYHYMTENLSGLKTFDHMVKRVQGLTEVRRSHDSHVTFLFIRL